MVLDPKQKRYNTGHQKIKNHRNRRIDPGIWFQLLCTQFLQLRICPPFSAADTFNAFAVAVNSGIDLIFASAPGTMDFCFVDCHTFLISLLFFSAAFFQTQSTPYLWFLIFHFFTFMTDFSGMFRLFSAVFRMTRSATVNIREGIKIFFSLFYSKNKIRACINRSKYFSILLDKIRRINDS